MNLDFDFWTVKTAIYLQTNFKTTIKQLSTTKSVKLQKKGMNAQMHEQSHGLSDIFTT